MPVPPLSGDRHLTTLETDNYYLGLPAKATICRSCISADIPQISRRK